MATQTINPTTGKVLETFEPFSQAQIDEILNQTYQAFLHWRTTSFAQRTEHILRVARYLREHKAELSRIAVLEMGKPLVEAEAEVEKCAWGCDYYAENAERFLADEKIATNATESYISFRPLGVVLALMPWNFPYWQVLRFAVPTLMAGNTVILKHASNVSRCALEIEHIFQECNFPQGMFRTVLLPGSKTSKLIADHRVAAVTLTGSENVGMAVASRSGNFLKKAVLELGGSDAFIVLEDANLDQAAKVAVLARFQNNGQSCIAAKRFIVVESIAEEFEYKFIEATARLRVDDPLKRETQLGPVARGDLRDDLDRQVQTSVTMGGRILLGGKPIAGEGYFYEPTIVTHVTPDMPIFREETFGPVAAVIRASSAEQAIELANNSDFGLGGNLWTGDIERGRELAKRIESGSVFINGMTASDPRLPFGGIKRSGYGRELSSFGIREFVNIQTVWIGPKTDAVSTTTAVNNK